jgi:hypothetical protein
LLLGALPAFPEGESQGVMLLTTDAACTVSVDGDPVADLVAHGTKKVPVAPGEHLVSAECPGLQRWEEVVPMQQEQRVVRIQPAAPAKAAAQEAPAPVGKEGDLSVTPTLWSAEPQPEERIKLDETFFWTKPSDTQLNFGATTPDWQTTWRPVTFYPWQQPTWQQPPSWQKPTWHQKTWQPLNLPQTTQPLPVWQKQPTWPPPTAPVKPVPVRPLFPAPKGKP